MRPLATNTVKPEIIPIISLPANEKTLNFKSLMTKKTAGIALTALAILGTAVGGYYTSLPSGVSLPQTSLNVSANNHFFPLQNQTCFSNDIANVTTLSPLLQSITATNFTQTIPLLQTSPNIPANRNHFCQFFPLQDQTNDIVNLNTLTPLLHSDITATNFTQNDRLDGASIPVNTPSPLLSDNISEVTPNITNVVNAEKIMPPTVGKITGFDPFAPTVLRQMDLVSTNHSTPQQLPCDNNFIVKDHRPYAKVIGTMSTPVIQKQVTSAATLGNTTYPFPIQINNKSMIDRLDLKNKISRSAAFASDVFETLGTTFINEVNNVSGATLIRKATAVAATLGGYLQDTGLRLITSAQTAETLQAQIQMDNQGKKRSFAALACGASALIFGGSTQLIEFYKLTVFFGLGKAIGNRLDFVRNPPHPAQGNT